MPAHGDSQVVAPGFSIAVPGDWIIIDLELAQDPAIIEQLIDSRIEQGVLSSDSRDAASAAIERVAHHAVESGMRFAAVLLADQGGGAFVASVTVASAVFDVPDPSGSMDSPDNAATVPAEQNSWFAASETAPRNTHSEDVRLPAGPAARIERIVPYPLAESVTQDVYSVQYVVPVDESGEALVITGTSPAIRRKDVLDRLFREIAETLEIEHQN